MEQSTLSNSASRFLSSMIAVALETQCIAPYGSLWKLNASLPMGRSAGRSK
ncbi:hypothetical protein [Leptospira noguchii]|uniref:hypothetical protein n=1 Tax=Leptospira noguchii TaxID=28182 RepID=UPI001FB5F4C8|nr:hypothetical protein [Leptospira noguchii]UOG51655.1 hypothetical protein MAL09_13260 [Leptospira noguchii]